MPPHDGQPGPDGSPPHANGQPMMPYYIHPGGYPPFPHYPPMYPSQGVTSSSGTPLQPPPAQGQAEHPQTINPADAARKPDDPSLPTAEQNGTAAAVAASVNKKRSKTTKNGEPKAKKVKVAARLEKDKDEEIPQPVAHSKPPTNDGSDPESPVASV
jgi:neural Wiskott-Aldrich syndrome protein